MSSRLFPQTPFGILRWSSSKIAMGRSRSPGALGALRGSARAVSSPAVGAGAAASPSIAAPRLLHAAQLQVLALLLAEALHLVALAAQQQLAAHLLHAAQLDLLLALGEAALAELEVELHGARRAVARQRGDAHAVLALLHRHEAVEVAVGGEAHVGGELAGGEVREHHVLDAREGDALEDRADVAGPLHRRVGAEGDARQLRRGLGVAQGVVAEGVGVDHDARLAGHLGGADRRLHVARLGDVARAERQRGHAVGEEQRDLLGVGPRRAVGSADPGELGDHQAHRRREVGGAPRAPREDRGEGAVHEGVVVREGHLEPGVLLVQAPALQGGGVHFAREGDHAHAHALGVEASQQRAGGLDLGVEHRVLGIRGDDLRGVGARRQQLLVGVHADHAVAVDVGAARPARGLGDVEHQQHVVAGGLVGVGAGAPHHLRLVELAFEHRAGSGRRDPHRHAGGPARGRLGGRARVGSLGHSPL